MDQARDRIMETTEVDGTLQQRILTILATVIRQDDTTHGVASSKDLRCAAWKIRWSEFTNAKMSRTLKGMNYRSCLFNYKSPLDEVERMFQEKPSNACCSLQARMPENCQAWQYKYWRRAWTSYFGYPTSHIDSMIHQQDSSIGRGTCLRWRLHCFHMYSPCISCWMIPNKRWFAQVSGRLWKDLLHPFLQHVDSNYILIGWKNRRSVRWWFLLREIKGNQW